MNTIEQIHSDFDTAVETLLEISNQRQQIAESLEVPQEEKDHADGLFLKEMWFGNAALAKKIEEFNNLTDSVKSQKRHGVEVSKSINSLVQKYQTLFPFHKFILYSQVIQICEKYNLYLSPSDFYKGEIPARNIQEMRDFPYDRAEEVKLTMNLSRPVCEQINGERYEKTRNYICGPFN